MGHNWDNIILVGMPGSGKSTIAVRLARKLGYAFVDGDRLIEEKHHKTLKEIIAERGNEGFFAVERDVLCGIDVHRTVIAPGGSVCYEPESIKHLRSIGTVVYLQVEYDVLEKRLGDLTARGVILRPGMTLKDLYHERTPIYRNSADVVIEEGHRTVRETVDALTGMIKRERQEQRNDTH